jgi:hypothetical protein
LVACVELGNEVLQLSYSDGRSSKGIAMSSRSRSKVAGVALESSPPGAPPPAAADGMPGERPLGAVFMLLANPDYARSVADRANALKLPSRHHRAVGDGADDKDGPDELLGPETADGMVKKARPVRSA